MSNKFKRNFITACIISALIAAGIVFWIRYSSQPRSCQLKTQPAQEETTIQGNSLADSSENPLTDAIKAYQPGNSTKHIEDLAKNKDLINKDDGISSVNGIPLVQAVLKRDLKLVEILLDHGADPNILNYTSYTPLMLATKNNDLLIMMALMYAGARVNASVSDFPNHGPTALCYAIETGSIEAIKLLLAHKADPNQVFIGGILGARNVSPLTYALAHDKSLKIIPLLIDAGADVNRMEGYHQNFTPLMAAAYFGNFGAIRLFKDAGADITAINGEGKTAFDYAKDGYDSIVEELSKPSEKGIATKLLKTLQIPKGTQMRASKRAMNFQPS